MKEVVTSELKRHRLPQLPRLCDKHLTRYNHTNNLNGWHHTANDHFDGTITPLHDEQSGELHSDHR